jgi:glycine/D-amino acid oxidase-like deaminating enzyme
VKTTPYWLEEPAPPLDRPIPIGRPDVIVIGGGVTGCACALRLAEEGVHVRLHEARRIAAGASGRNGGFALRGLALPYDVAAARLGRAHARAMTAATEDGLSALEALAGDAFDRTGSLRLAADDDELHALAAEYEALAADGFAVEWVDDLDEPIRGLYRGALLHPSDGSIQPARWVRRLAGHAAAAGAEIREESPIALDAAEREADAVVVATDGFTAAVVPELAASVRPTRGQMLATEPLPEIRYRRPHYARNGFDYWQQLSDGRLVLGGRRDAAVDEEWTDVEQPTETIQQHLEVLSRDLTGGSVSVSHRWAGIWGTTPDSLPLAGRIPGRERAWVAAGYSGHGNVLGFVCGSLVADALLGRPADLLGLFDPARFG